MTRRLTRAQLLAAVVAERWPDPAAAERERPPTPEQLAERRRVLAAAMPTYCPSRPPRHQEASAA